MLFVYAPVVKPCEPPAGIARLAGLLRRYGARCSAWDANLEGLLWLMRATTHETDRWSVRAFRSVSKNLACLRDIKTYGSPDRYKRAVADLNRVLDKRDDTLLAASASAGCSQISGDSGASAALSDHARISLSNYQDARLSPIRCSDLLWAAEHPEHNPFFAFFSERLRRAIEEEQPRTVGFSLNFLSQALCTFAMLGFLRRELPHVQLVLGGGLVTSWMRRPGWVNPFGRLIDQLVAGPGEEALLSILGVASGPEANSRSMAHVRPDYSGFPVEGYLSPGFILPYSASTGCYWSRCSFCPERAERSPYIPVPVAAVVEDLRELTEQMHPVLIHLLDNAVSPALMEGLCASPPGAPWYGFVRITHHLADPDFCHALKRSGCVMLKLGIESGDQDVLDREQKGMDLGMASKALKALHEAGIATYVYLLFGTPSETREAAGRTLEFTVRHSSYIDFLNLAIFNMPVYGTEVGCFETSLLYEGDLSLYTGFKHPKGWDRGLVRQFLDKEFKRHPAIAEILKNDPPQFTSNHAPFLARRDW